MNMRVTVKVEGLREVQEALRGFSDRRVAAAMATALTRTALAVRDAEQAEMRDSFDRPTPFTLNSLFVKPATALVLQADVFLKDNVSGSRPASSWLQWQIGGGLRTLKAFERLLISGGYMRADDRAVPGRAARLDSYGNLSKGQIVQILGQLRLDSSTGSTRSLPRVQADDNAKTKRDKLNRIRRSLGRAGGRYVALPNGTRTLLPGIYLNEGRDFGAKIGYGASRRLRPVLIFVSKAEYEPERFDFYGVSRRVVERTLQAQLERAIGESAGRLANRTAK